MCRHLLCISFTSSAPLLLLVPDWCFWTVACCGEPCPPAPPSLRPCQRLFPTCPLLARLLSRAPAPAPASPPPGQPRPRPEAPRAFFWRDRSSACKNLYDSLRLHWRCLILTLLSLPQAVPPLNESLPFSSIYVSLWKGSCLINCCSSFGQGQPLGSTKSFS